MADVYSKFILDIVQAVNNNKIIQSAMLQTFRNITTASKAANATVSKNFTNWHNQAKALHQIMGEGWWSKFGSVALGFTLAYRAMNVFEAGLSKTTSLLKESIVEFGELSALQAKLAYWQVMGAKNTMTYAEAYAKAAVNVQALYKASINSISSLSELATGMDEIAQSIGSVPAALIPQLASVVDFTSMVAQTTGSTTRQIRQELQSLMNGQMRTTDMLGRTMKKLGVLTEEDFVELKKMTNQAEKLKVVFAAIDKYWSEARQKMIENDPSTTFAVWEKTVRNFFINLQQAASKGLGKNIFSDTILKSIEKFKTSFSPADQARLVLFIKELASAFGKLLNLLPRFINIIGYGAAFIKIYHEEIGRVWEVIKKLLLIGTVIALVDKLTKSFMRLYSITSVLGTNLALVVIKLAEFGNLDVFAKMGLGFKGLISILSSGMVTLLTAGTIIALFAFVALEAEALWDMKNKYFPKGLLFELFGIDVIDEIKEKLKGFFNYIKDDFFQDILKFLNEKFKGRPYMDVLQKNIQEAIDKNQTLGGVISDVTHNIAENTGGFGELFTIMKKNAGDHIDWFINLFKGIPEKMKGVLGKLDFGDLDISTIFGDKAGEGLGFSGAADAASNYSSIVEELTKTLKKYTEASAILASYGSVTAKDYLANQDALESFIAKFENLTDAEKEQAIALFYLTQQQKNYYENAVAMSAKMSEAYSTINANDELIRDYIYATDQVASGEWSTFAAKHWVDLQEKMRSIHKEVIKYPPEIQDALEQSLIAMAEAEDRYSKEIEAGLHWSEDLIKGIAQSTANAFETGFFGMMKGEFGSFKDWLRSWADQVLQIIAQIMSKIATMKLMGNALETGELGGAMGEIAGFFGYSPNSGYGAGFSSTGRVETNPGLLNMDISGLGYHGGGRVGSGGTHRWIPDSLLNFAPRLHRGLMRGEFPAILQQGEEVLTSDQQRQRGSGGETHIHINAMDAKSFSEYLTKNRGALTGPMNSILRSSRSARSAMRGSVS
jgi:hypothetical protein